MPAADPAVARDDERRRQRELAKGRLEIVIPPEAEQDRIIRSCIAWRIVFTAGVSSVSSIETPITTRPRDL